MNFIGPRGTFFENKYNLKMNTDAHENNTLLFSSLINYM